MTSGFDPDTCPLCGRPNQCAMEIERATGVAQGACWCTEVNFSPELLASIPAPARGASCVCAACASDATLKAQMAHRQ